MLRKVGAFILFALAPAASLPAAAADLPDVLTGPRNAVPDCATPGRLMAFLKLRNPELNPRYDSIATEYMRQGEKLGMRWDYAFYQMIIETGALSYWRGNRSGDVKPEQNNLAGLGATGKGERGESFKDIETGVRAHLEHLMLYAGRPVDNPAAERTRKVREWGVLTSWQQSFKRPITYGDLAAKWAPGANSYQSMLLAVAERFHADVCSKPDPRPGLVQEARGSMAKTADARPLPSPGTELAQRAIEQAKAAGNEQRSALGAQLSPSSPPPFVPFKVLNPPAPADTPTQSPSTAAVKAGALPDLKTVLAPGGAAKAPPTDKSSVRTAAAATKAKGLTEAMPPPPAASQKCRVWTASYGGQKALIIRAVVDQVVNYTVLDVNEGSETREAQAFIAAYAKDGKIAGEYNSQAMALDKAFELCPEG
jgi:Mannosyl-glycoprotein endo-beta-N-acetylglucosaminidase